MAFGHQRLESRRLLLREISKGGRIPRIDLAERTGISRATVTAVTADLLKGGLIEEIPRDPEAEDSARGRPKIDLKISGNAHLVAGLKVSGHSISFVLMDFEGADIETHEEALPNSTMTPVGLADAIARGLDALAAKVDGSVADLSGLGVGLAGLVQADTGLVHWSPSLTQRNVNLHDVLSARLGLPVFADNDANLVAMAELTFGLGRDHSDFIVITIESGVGMGLVLGGQIYRGTRGCGAEFGHTKINFEGALCRCGQRGCLEAYVADYALVRDASSVLDIDPKGSTAEAVAQVLAAARAGHGAARNVVDRAGRMFAVGLANLVNVFDPQLIILAGEQMQFDHLYADAVIDEMRKSIVQVDKPPPRVEIHKWGNLMWARGAAAYALEFVQDIAVESLDHAR
ncbi:MAG: ROK family transcriptional regulator [Pseudomonadota bacterium]|mgnify:FL=1